MAVSTKNVSTEPSVNPDGYIKSIMSPGNHRIKILTIELKPERDREKFGDKLVLKVETEEITIPNFKGLLVDKEKPELGTYKGQVGFIAYSKWGFKDFESGPISALRDEELLRAIKIICEELKIVKWFDDADGKYETVDDLIIGFNKEAPFKDIYFHACIAGREYMNKEYLNYEMFFPREHRTLGRAFSSNADKVQKFFESMHIERMKPKADTAALAKTETSTETKPKVENSEDAAREKELEELEKLSAEMNQETTTTESTSDIIVNTGDEKMPWDI